MIAQVLCAWFGHPTFNVVCQPPQMLKLRTYQIDGELLEREVPGFYRTRTCPRCKFVHRDIVFTAAKTSAPAADLPGVEL